MKYTGFGVLNGYTTLFCFDNSFKGGAAFSGIAWPAQNTPLTYYTARIDDVWTYSHGKVIIKDDIQVTLKNLTDGTIYKFDKNDQSKFKIQNNYYGITGCVVFKPSLKYKDGDKFEVGIHGTEVNVDYTVHFFDL